MHRKFFGPKTFIRGKCVYIGMEFSRRQQYFAEVLGTFVLVFIGAGAVVANAVSGGSIGILGIAIAHGLAIAAMVYAVGNVSGCHINPAITLSFLAARKINLRTAVSYIVSQLIGAALAGFALFIIFPIAPNSLMFGATQLGDGVTSSIGILIELLLTFLLAFAIFAVATDKRNQTVITGLVIGMVLSMSIIVGGTSTGAALNPARSFGPLFGATLRELVDSVQYTGIGFDLVAVAAKYFANHYIYWIGPVAGALLALIVYEKIFGDAHTRNRKKA